MHYSTAAGFRRALEDRLRGQARSGAEPVTRLRKNVAFQRLLARLVQLSPDRWILKGALALDFRLQNRPGARPRATRDMDLVHLGLMSEADADLQRAQELDLGDYFEFLVQRTELTEEEKEAGGAGLRYRVRAVLAGRLFEEVMVDVGAAPAAAPWQLLEGPDLLAFANVPPVRVLALPTVLHVAEKLHAYTRHYGVSRAPSSRPKDLVDLVLLAAHEEFVARDLTAALEETFAARGTHPLPEALPAPPVDWARPFAELAVHVRISPTLADAHQRAGLFLNPILGHQVAEGSRWDPLTQEWTAPERLDT